MPESYPDRKNNGQIPKGRWNCRTVTCSNDDNRQNRFGMNSSDSGLQLVQSQIDFRSLHVRIRLSLE
jgi:hypothetical protein